MGQFVASARMYAVAPGAGRAWRALLTHVGKTAGVALEIVEHAYPATLADLWGNPDLGCAFMCGWPLALENKARGTTAPHRKIIAAPVPDAAWSAGSALYRSDFLVSAKSSFQTIEETFGHRFSYNALHSHSGANMPRAFLAPFADRAPLYAAMVGPLTTPRRCIEAVVTGDADVTAVDSFALQLLRRHDPVLAGGIRVIASTAASPIPPFVASATLPVDTQAQLQRALVQLHLTEPGRALLADLCLLGFVPADSTSYATTLSVEAAAIPLSDFTVQA